MPKQTELWNLKITCATEQEPLLEKAFEDDCVAYSSLLTPDGSTLNVEILFQEKPDIKLLQDKLSQINALIQTPIIRFEIVSMGNLDWIREVAQHLEPISIGRWTIYGAAFRDSASSACLGLQIDATSAFGTGEHPTTRGCLLMLDELLGKSSHTEKWSMLDMGCGSGILAMAFAKATGGQAFGIDMDEDSIEIAQDNLKTNKLVDKVHIACGLGYTPSLVGAHGPYDLIMANVFADPLCEMAADLKQNLKPGGHAILSGILNDQAERVVLAHLQQGLALLERKVDGEWSVLALYRPVDAS
ncbi:MAG: 50S ribosomal protein L11 methyltransferase [Alphaproteobacteria bacterium]|nr:50S ribosomal protein L11 methyltransferase [Alphaproteobacteria bacterium]